MPGLNISLSRLGHLFCRWSRSVLFQQVGGQGRLVVGTKSPARRHPDTEWTRLPGADGETIRELYDVLEDPFEYNNPAVNGAHEAVVTRLSRRLKAGWRLA